MSVSLRDKNRALAAQAVEASRPTNDLRMQLATVLPQGGEFVTFTLADRQHQFHPTVDALMAYVESRIDTQGLYFAVAAFGPERNRTQANVRALRAYRLDLDAGAEKLAKHGADKVYATQQEAIAGVVAAAKSTLPMPTLVISSGEGLHVYWALSEDVEPTTWKPTAQMLQGVSLAAGLKVDTAVTCDTARILRPVGTLHPNGNRVAVLKNTQVIYGQSEIHALLQSRMPADSLGLSPVRVLRDINADVLGRFHSLPASLERVAEQCSAVAAMRNTQGNIPEPHWRAVIGIAKYCDVDGERLAHEWSTGHPNYDPRETQAKYDRWETPPTTCEHFATMHHGCTGCPHAGKITTPKQLGVSAIVPTEAHEASGAAPQITRATLLEVLPDWSRTKEGEKVKPHNTTDNLAALARLAGASIRYNVMARKTEIVIPGMKSERDDFDNAALAVLGDTTIRAGMKRDGIKELADAVAGQSPYHPVLQWIEATPWDGQSRTAKFHQTLELVDQTWQLLRASLVDAWMLQGVGALLEDAGIAAQGMLVLAGEQGRNKTRWFEHLCPVSGAVRTGLTLNPQDKDSVYQSTSAFIVELGELDSTFRKADLAAMKAFITRPEDILRRPYALTDNTYRRRTIFGGTVNDVGFLADDTGNRRYWTLHVRMCHLLTAEEMQQVWAEYLHRYRAGERWHFDDQTKAALQESNAEHQVTDPLREQIQVGFDWSKVNGPEWHKAGACTWMTATQVCHRVGRPDPSKGDATRAGSIVRSLNGGTTRKSGDSRLLALPPARPVRA